MQSHIYPAHYVGWRQDVTSASATLTCYFHRYYFVVEEDNTPLSVTVTPCDAPLEWKLTLQELPEEASGEGSGITDTREHWERLMTRSVEISPSPTHN